MKDCEWVTRNMSHVPYGSIGEQPVNVPRTDGAGRGSRSRPLDAIFELLVAQRRREVLYVLYRRPGPITVSELTDEVASVEETPPERVATALHHVHLPKLDERGVVNYDAEAGTVRLVDDSNRLYRYLRAAAADEGRFLGSADDGVASDEADARQSQP